MQLRGTTETDDYVSAAETAAVLDVTCCFHGGGENLCRIADLGVGYDQVGVCVRMIKGMLVGAMDGAAEKLMGRTGRAGHIEQLSPAPLSLLPDRPSDLRHHAAEVRLPRPTSPALDESLLGSHLRALPSFISLEQVSTGLLRNPRASLSVTAASALAIGRKGLW